MINTTPTNLVCTVANGALALSWPGDHIGWRLQSQTNTVSAGIGTNWVDVAGSQSTNSVFVPIDPNNGSVFLRLAYP